MSKELLHPSHWPSWLLVGFFRLVGLLPFPVLWAVGMLSGRPAYFLAGFRRRIVLRNLEIRNPAIDAQMRRSLTQFGALSVERKNDLRGMLREIRDGTPFFYLPNARVFEMQGGCNRVCGPRAPAEISWRDGE